MSRMVVLNLDTEGAKFHSDQMNRRRPDQTDGPDPPTEENIDTNQQAQKNGDDARQGAGQHVIAKQADSVTKKQQGDIEENEREQNIKARGPCAPTLRQG